MVVGARVPDMAISEEHPCSAASEYVRYVAFSCRCLLHTEYIQSSPIAQYSSRIKTLDKPAYNYTNRNDNNQPVGFGGMMVDGGWWMVRRPTAWTSPSDF